MTRSKVDEQLQHPITDLELVARVLAFHRARLTEIADGHREDARFTSGLAWGLYALERVDRALRGQTDAAQLGFERDPATLPNLPPSRKDRA